MAEGGKQGQRATLAALGFTAIGLLSGGVLYAFTTGSSVGDYRTTQSHNSKRIETLEVEVKGLATGLRDEMRRNFEQLNTSVGGIQTDLANLKGRLDPVRLSFPNPSGGHGGPPDPGATP